MFYTFISILLKTKFIFRKPTKTSFLIYDKFSGLFLSKLLPKNSYGYLSTRYEEINLYVLAITLLKFKFRNIRFNYLLNYIRTVNPNKILTINHMDLDFLYFKYFFKKPVFIMIQNNVTGLKGTYSISNVSKNHKMSKIKKGRVDYLLLFGENMRVIYNKYFDYKKYISIGSINNNFAKITKKVNKKKQLIFISQFKDWKKISNDKITRDGVNFIQPSKYYLEIDKKMLNFLSYYEIKKKISFKILLKSKKKSEEKVERKYFKEMGIETISFISSRNSKKTYSIISKLNNFITFDSTLGYEALSRGKKVIFVDKLNLKKFASKKLISVISPIKFQNKELSKIADSFFNNSYYRKINQLASDVKKLSTYSEKNNKLTTFLNNI